MAKAALDQGLACGVRCDGHVPGAKSISEHSFLPRHECSQQTSVLTSAAAGPTRRTASSINWKPDAVAGPSTARLSLAGACLLHGLHPSAEGAEACT